MFWRMLNYKDGEISAEEMWQAMGECAQYVARAIADREGCSRPPAAVRMLIPDCEINRETELIA